MKSKLPVPRINLPLIHDERGDLVFGEYQKHFPFLVKRIFYIFNVKKGGQRGFHAHKKNILALFCLRGSATLKLDNGQSKAKVFLSKSNEGVIIPPKIWHSIEDFAPDTIFLALCSERYDENDYLRDYEEFKKYILSCN